MPPKFSDLLLLPSRREFARKADRAREPSKAELDAVRQVRQRAAELESARDRDLQDLVSTLRDAAERFGATMTPHDRQQQQIAGAAIVREAVRRTSSLRYHGVQLLAGLALANGHVVEMATGEGKTIVSAIPAFLAWLDGRQTHVATPNAYLAERDCEQLKPVFEMLGVTVSLLPERNDLRAKAAAYQQDVVYGTGYEFGFDYLRNQLSLRSLPREKLGVSVLDSLLGRDAFDSKLLQPRLQLTVVDEIDSVLIDE
ncbi:MAG: preprotein translocase subunit SecA, partial [Planctomycetota bacterium]